MSKTKETYPDYLRRVGADYRESGSDATAEDYDTAAQVIEDLIKAVKDHYPSYAQGYPNSIVAGILKKNGV